MQRRALVGICAVVPLVAGGPLGAQRVNAARAGAAPGRPPTSPVWILFAPGAPGAPGVPGSVGTAEWRPGAPAPARRRARRAPYVLGGALVGAAAGGVFVLRGARQCARDGCMLFPAVAAVTVAVPAGVGALAGLGVSQAVRDRVRP